MLYDTIGKSYSAQRMPDPRIAAIIHRALGTADSVVNVGAGTGSYEPIDRPVIAIEPSMTMIRQRRPGAAPAVQAVAESLPLRDRCTAAATAFLTVHHWSDVDRGLQELGRIARALGPVSTFEVPVPHDCIDGFLGANWRRPDAYLDPAIRSGVSGFSNLPGLEEGLARLRHDLGSGEWHRRFGHLLERESLDIGYRLVVARVQ